ncbi:MAG TPA: hypothetical protein VMD52_01495 [Patescibacteria group bacterium]|nr:hypothetical protein [Patescibacteria group bacterium]
MPTAIRDIRLDRVTFICQITEDSLNLARYSGTETAGRITNLLTRPLAPSVSDADSCAQLRQALRDIGYRKGSFLLCIPRSQATCRYLKVPASVPSEIEKIISLQASTYLPYPAHELIIGYQVISVDKEGYSYLNVVIVHKSVIERYLQTARAAGARKIAVVLSSYGLVSLYNRFGRYDNGSVLLIACDSHQAELAVAGHKKLLFSRHIRLDGHPHDWQQELVTQVRKTREAYAEEVHGAVLHKIAILGKGSPQESFSETLGRESVLPVENIMYAGQLGLGDSDAQTIVGSSGSLTGFLGLGLSRLPGSLNLLTAEMKQQASRFRFIGQALEMLLAAAAIVAMLALAHANMLRYKTGHLNRLRSQIGALEPQAKPLDELERRLRALDNRAHQKPAVLDILYALHTVLPPDISLSSFGYQEGARVILRGQAKALDGVVGLVAELGRAQEFKAFEIKVKYATIPKGGQSAEAVDFELVCSRK